MKLDAWEMQRALAERDPAAVLAIFARHSPEICSIPASDWLVYYPVGQRYVRLLAPYLFMQWREGGIVRSNMLYDYSPSLYLPPRLGA